MGIFGKKKTAEDWFRLAQEHSDAGKVLECYSKGLELEPDNAFAWHAKACMHAVLHGRQEAIESFNRALALKVDEKVFAGAIQALIGGVHYNWNRYVEATEYYDKAIDADPAISGVCWHLKAHAFWDSNRREDAIECFNKAMELGPEVEKLRLHAIATSELIADPGPFFGSPSYANYGVRSETLHEYLSDYQINIPPQVSGELQAEIRAMGMTLKRYPEPSNMLLINAFAEREGTRQAVEFLGNTENIGGEIPFVPPRHVGFSGQVVTPELNEVAREYAHNLAPWLVWGLAFDDKDAFKQVQETLDNEGLLEAELPSVYRGVILDLPRFRRELNFFNIYYRVLGTSGMGYDLPVSEEDFTYRDPSYDVEIVVPADQARAISIWRMVLWSFR